MNEAEDISNDENSWISEGGSMADEWPNVIHGAGCGISEGMGA